MVHANALELHALTIEGKPRIGVEVEETVPEVNVIRVDDTIFLLDLGANGIQVRIIQGPELGGSRGDGILLDRCACARSDVGGSALNAGNCLLRSATTGDHRLHDLDGGVFVPLVGDDGLEMSLHLGFVGVGKLWSGHDYAIAIDVHGIGDHEIDIATDTRSGIPTARRRLMVRLYGDRVGFTELKVLGDVVRERRVAIGVVAKLVTVDPHRRVHVHAIEIDTDRLALEGFAHREALAVPADTTQLVATLGLTGGGVFLIDAVIMRKVDVLPCGVIELLALGATCIAKVELPILIEVLRAHGRIAHGVDVDELGLRTHLRRRLRPNVGCDFGPSLCERCSCDKGTCGERADKLAPRSSMSQTCLHSYPPSPKGLRLAAGPTYR